MKKIYMALAMLIGAISGYAELSHSQTQPLDETRRKDVIEFIHFVQKKKPDLVAAYKDDVFSTYNFCAGRLAGQTPPEAGASVAGILAELIREFELHMPGQEEIASQLLGLKVITLGMGGPRLTYSREIRENVFRYLTEVHAAVVDQDYTMCVDLLVNLFETASDRTKIASRD